MIIFPKKEKRKNTFYRLKIKKNTILQERKNYIFLKIYKKRIYKNINFYKKKKNQKR